MTYHVCTECPIHHYDNCNTCFGFGVYSPGNPVAAAEATREIWWIDTFPCPECGSTVKGVPDETNRTAHNA